jgi:hypothetical protein
VSVSANEERVEAMIRMREEFRCDFSAKPWLRFPASYRSRYTSNAHSEVPFIPVGDASAYLEGPAGRTRLSFISPVLFRRIEGDRIVVINRFSLDSSSDLVGRPIASLRVLLDQLIEEAIEKNDLSCGGGGGETWEFFVTSNRKRASVSEGQRHRVEARLHSNRAVRDYTLSAPIDACMVTFETSQ